MVHTIFTFTHHFLGCNDLNQQVRLNCAFRRSPSLVNLMVGCLVGRLVCGLVVAYPTCSATSSKREWNHYSCLSQYAIRKGRGESGYRGRSFYQNPEDGSFIIYNFFLFPKLKLKLKVRRFDTIEEIQAESQRVHDTVIEKDFQEAFQKWRGRWDRCLHAGGNYFEGDGGR